MYTSAFQSHMLLYFPSPVQPVRWQTPLFPGIKTFLFKGDGAEIFLNVTLSQMPFKFHPSFHLCCVSLSFLLKKKPIPSSPHMHTPHHPYVIFPISLVGFLVCCCCCLLKSFSLFSVAHPADSKSEKKLHLLRAIQEEPGCPLFQGVLKLQLSHKMFFTHE